VPTSFLTERRHDEQERLRKFRPIATRLHDNDLKTMIEDAKKVMGISDSYRDKSGAFSKDVLRIEICGPQMPSLTLVDLPGLIQVPTGNQTQEDLDIINNMVKEYIRKPRSIILPIIYAPHDPSCQRILKMVQMHDVDARGLRTYGIVTKPDTLSVGSELEDIFLKVAQNQKYHFKLGWHVLKNRNILERDFSSAKRNIAEKTFLDKGRWKDVEAESKGVGALKTRLSQLLFSHIQSELPDLPDLLDELSQKLSEVRQELKQLGTRHSISF
jgi:hypothetical protein